MNPAFKYYGKQPSSNIEREALIVQSKYGLNDMQLAGILQIHDFFLRVATFDESVYKLQLETVEKRGGERIVTRAPLPEKTRNFFSDFNKCEDSLKYFNKETGHKYFQRFADNVLTNISRQSEYVAPGLIKYVHTDPSNKPSYTANYGS